MVFRKFFSFFSRFRRSNRLIGACLLKKQNKLPALQLLTFARIISLKMDAAIGFDGNTSVNGEKLIYPAANRNKEPILEVLKRFLSVDYEDGANRPIFLEVSSGSGQHVAHFAPHFPGIMFQPSEFDETLIGSITYYAQSCITKNVLKPMIIDVRKDFAEYGFQESSIDFIFNANMMHISPYECSIGLFQNAGKYLKNDSLLITYGPYSKDGVITPHSNVSFNESLKARDPEWGLRDITELVQLAQRNNLVLIDTIDMPANNQTLIWKKE